MVEGEAEGRAVLGRGRTADVLEWGPGQVLKLYQSWWPPEKIDYEARIGRAVRAAGIPSPWVGAVVEVQGRHGLVYQRLPGVSMLDALLSEHHRLGDLALSCARLHAALHARAGGDLLSQVPGVRSRLRHGIESVAPGVLPADLKAKVLALLDKLPDGDRVCHGDFHPANILISREEMYLIDWENISGGDPLADVARTLLLLDTAYLSSPVLAGVQMRGMTADFARIYLEEYARISGADPGSLVAWRAPVAAARLHEGIEAETEYLLAAIRRAWFRL